MKSVKCWRALLTLLASTLSTSHALAATGFSFTFTLPHRYVTSAAVYGQGGQLVKNLWSKRALPAGTTTHAWDGTLNDGSDAPAGTYTVKVLYHNMSYEYQGLVGNTSANLGGAVDLGQRWSAEPWGATYWTANDFIKDMAFDVNGNGFAVLGYGERAVTVDRFDVKSPQRPIPAVQTDYNELMFFVTTDGARYYVASLGNGWDNYSSSFVLAYNVNGNSPYAFASGQAAATSVVTYPSAIDVHQKNGASAWDQAFADQNRPSGLAVMSNGNILAVSHGGLNQVLLFDKTTGANAGSIPVTNPGRIAFSPSGELWVISEKSVLGFTNVGGSNSNVTTLSGLSAPVAVAVNPLTGDVLVADAGTNQQVFAYDSAGAPKWTLGQRGGYLANGPAVAMDKFHFTNVNALSYMNGNTGSDRNAYGRADGFIAFQSDGSYWVADMGNERVLHFSSANAYIDQIAYIPSSMSCAVDPNNPSRVFSGWREYAINYNVPMQPGDPSSASGNGWWTLVNNWQAGVDTSIYYYPAAVVTLKNGHTYGQAYDLRTSGGARFAFFELPPNGQVRWFPQSTEIQPKLLYGNGDLRWADSPGAVGRSGTQTAYAMPLSGFVADGASEDPQWGQAAPIASVSVGAADPIDVLTAENFPFEAPQVPITASNYVLFFTPLGNAIEPNNHLGAVPAAGSSWLWQASPGSNAVNADGLGSFEDQQGYGGHDGVAVFADGHDIVWGYDGQSAQSFDYSNQFVHYWDDGLFVGQYGNQDTHWWKSGGGWDTGTSDNIGTMALARANGVLYSFNADQSYHSGVHVWKHVGEVRELSVSSANDGGVVDLGTAGAWLEPNVLLNPNFDSEQSTAIIAPAQDAGADGGGGPAAPIGWTQTGTRATYTGTRGPADAIWNFAGYRPAHSGAYYAYQYSANAYENDCAQTVTNISNGTYTLTAWVMSSGGQSSAVMYAGDYGGDRLSANIPSTTEWTQISLTLDVTNNQSTVGFASKASGGQWIAFDDVRLVKPDPNDGGANDGGANDAATAPTTDVGEDEAGPSSSAAPSAAAGAGDNSGCGCREARVASAGWAPFGLLLTFYGLGAARVRARRNAARERLGESWQSPRP